MAFNYTQEEKNALDEKITHPETEVICPRCGKKLIYNEVGASCEVKCETNDCLYASIRGI